MRPLRCFPEDHQMSKGNHNFSAVEENIRALSADTQTKKWMSRRPQMCWKCQKDKPMKNGTIKMFGTVRRFICADCVLAKQIELARGEA
jgi:hypothetical protein